MAKRKKLKITDPAEQWRIFQQHVNPKYYVDLINILLDVLREVKMGLDEYEEGECVCTEKLDELEKLDKRFFFDWDICDDWIDVVCYIRLVGTWGQDEENNTYITLPIKFKARRGLGRKHGIDCPHDIRGGTLFSNVFTKDYLADALCNFDPYNLQMWHWLY